MSLNGKKIVVGITGSIAAYKMPHFVRLLVKAGAEVKVLLTQAAAQFVSPLSLSTVSKHEVLSSVHNGEQWNNHVALGLWADAMIIAPCSANTLAKLAHGLCDNILTAVYLSARCPIFIAPAMDEDMWLHPSTRANLAHVREFGNHIIPAVHGELASGLVGEGRMAEPEDMQAMLTTYFEKGKPLSGVSALVTAGPTFERIDPVRFIGNFSTGKMGIAVAEALARAGAEVTLVLGPTHVRTTHQRVHTIMVESAREMYDVASGSFATADIAILAAAVADYRPAAIASDKIKKQDGHLTLELTRTPDILASLGKIKQPHQTLIGFALETNNEVEHARHKLERKNADMIVLNSLQDAGAGFGHDTNKITFIKKNGETVALPLQSKKDAAVAIVDQVIALRHVETIA